MSLLGHKLDHILDKMLDYIIISLATIVLQKSSIKFTPI